MVLVLLSMLVKRFSVSRMQDFFLLNKGGGLEYTKKWCNKFVNTVVVKYTRCLASPPFRGRGFLSLVSKQVTQLFGDQHLVHLSGKYIAGFL